MFLLYYYVYLSCLQEILPTLEDLHFPPEWRTLFNTAGVPQAALDDVDSTRTLIGIVTRTLDKMERPVDVPALKLYDSDDDDDNANGMNKFSNGGHLKAMDWETDDSDSDNDSFRQLQQEVLEAAAQYRGAVGTSRSVHKLADGLASRRDGLLSPSSSSSHSQWPHGQATMSSRSEKTSAKSRDPESQSARSNKDQGSVSTRSNRGYGLNADVNLSSNGGQIVESPRLLPEGQRSSFDDLVTNAMLATVVRSSPHLENLSAGSIKQRILSSGSKSARSAHTTKSPALVDGNLRRSFPDSELRFAQSDSHVQNIVDNNVQRVVDSHVEKLPPPPPPPPPPFVPPLDMSLLISPPPPQIPDFISEVSIASFQKPNKPAGHLEVIPSAELVLSNAKQPPVASHQSTEFDLRSSMLIEQKSKLRSTEQPHPNQLTDLSAINQDIFNSIAEVIRKVGNLMNIV